MSTFVHSLAPIAAIPMAVIVLSSVSFVYGAFTASNWFMSPATVTHTTKRTARRPVKDTM